MLEEQQLKLLTEMEEMSKEYKNSPLPKNKKEPEL